MSEIEIHLWANGEARDAARYMDWGVVVDSNQGGVTVFVVGLPPGDAAKLLREAADAFDAPQTPAPPDASIQSGGADSLPA